MKPIKAAKNILDIAKESRNKFAITGTEFDKVQANMYSVFECYAHGVISWDTTKKYFQESIKKYLSLHKDNMLKEERASMKQEYKRVVVEYKIALDEYRKVNEQKLSNKLLKHVGFIGESAAQAQSKKYYNERALTESELKDTASLSWERVMEAYPNLTTKDEDRVRMLTIFEGPTVDTTQMITTVMKEDDINFNPNAGHMDQPSHPQNRGLTKRSTSPRPKLRPKNFDQIKQRADINKAVRSAMGEGWKELPPIDRDRYQERPGLEGPFSTLSGKVVYYDPKEGKYYDPDTDMYLSYDEFKALDNDRSGMKESIDAIQRIVTDKQAEKVHGVLVDLFTASAITQVYDAVNDQNKAAIDKMLTTKVGLMKISDFAMKQLSENTHNLPAHTAGFRTGIRFRNGGLASGPVSKSTYDREMDAFNQSKTTPKPKAPTMINGPRVNEEMSDDEIDAFHRALDALVHKHLGHSSDEVEERKMTKSEKAKEERLKDKYDDSDMKASMKKQYGDDWENVYYATIRKQAMEDNEDFDIDLNDPDQAVEAAFHVFKSGLKKGVNQHKMRMQAHEELAFDIGMSSVMKKLPDGGKSLHQQLDKLIIDAINKMDTTGEIPESENKFDGHDIMSEDPPNGIDFDYANLSKVNWEQYSEEDIKTFYSIVDNLSFESGYYNDGEFDDSHFNALQWLEKNVMKKTEAKRRPDHNMQAQMRLQKIMQQAIKDSKKKRGIEDDDEKERTDEMTSAGGIASVAQPMGKMQRRKKTVEDEKKSPAGGPACWDGKKIHPTKPTKMKGGKRVNNCIDDGK